MPVIDPAALVGILAQLGATILQGSLLLWLFKGGLVYIGRVFFFVFDNILVILLARYIHTLCSY